MLNPKNPRVDSPEHLAFIRRLPCLVTKKRAVPAHIRKGNGGGMAYKSGDDCTLPLCQSEHQKQHDIGELRYWYPYGGYETATVLAKDLYKHTGDWEKCVSLLAEYRRKHIEKKR